MSENGTLSFVRSPVIKHFRGYSQLFKTAKPIGDGLELADEFIKLVAERRRRT